MGTLKVNGSMPKINCNKTLNKINVNGVTVWSNTKVLFNTNDSETQYMWKRDDGNGWGKATALKGSSANSFNVIDCTGYSKCIVRIKGNISGTPAPDTVNNSYARIGFTSDYNSATNVLHKWNDSSGGSGADGVAYDTWHDLTLDVSALTGNQTLNVFFGGATFGNTGVLYCSKITMTN